MKLSVQNYQIVKKAVLEFKPGLTAIVGPSNNGKSSLIKAFKSAVYTEPGATPIRYGADSYIVGIQKDNHTVIFQKKESSSKYIVDGQQYSKFGLNTPKEVSDALNIKELILNGNKVHLNFWDQMDKPFLLDKSAGELFKFIVDSGENDQLSSVLKSMVSDRQQINRDADVTQGSIISTEKMIETQSKLIENAKESLALADKIIDLREKYEEYKKLKSLVEEYEITDKEIKELRPKLLNNLNEFNRYNSLNYLIEVSVNLLSDLQQKLKQLNLINNEISTSKNELNKLDIKERIFDKIQVQEIKKLKSLVQEYKFYNIELENVTYSNVKLQKAIPSQITLDNLKLLVELKNIKFNVDYIDECLIKEKGSIKNVKEKELELDKIQNLVKVCPYCGQKIGGEHVHTEVNS